MTTRRAFMAVVAGGLLAAPLAARAQRAGKVWRIGLISVAYLKIEDILFTFGLIIGSIERDLGPVSNLGPWFAAPGMRFPGATELWERALPRHVTGLSIRVEGGPS